MRRKTSGAARKLGVLAAFWLAAALAMSACSGDEGLSCGAGTTLKDGKCVLVASVDACGAGTVQQGNTCVPADGGAVDAGGGNDTGGGQPDIAQDAGTDTSSADTATPPDTAGDAAGDTTADGGSKPCNPACSPAEQCVQGVCEPLPPPETWQCATSAWADGKACDCDCGGADPDCQDAKLPVSGCASGVCEADGKCKPCVPSCAGKECGDNGCGGSCGACNDPAKPICEAGKCAACTPKCDGKACGGDGCGGSCGDCDIGKVCNVGACVHPPPTASCFGQCGKVTASGCACTADCADKGNCCVNVHVCGCLPQCDGKVCGDDGCGGSCGDCKAGNVCIQGSCQQAVCTPLTCNGHGTCEPQTATCACEKRFAPPYCDQCDKGYVDFPNCVTACNDDKGCDDGNPCTKDVCEAKGGCVNLPIAATCSDGDACTSGDVCKAGKCTGGGATDCDDDNACTTDSCDKAKGCAHAVSGEKGCDDGDKCTTGDTCAGTSCQAGKAVSCEDGNVCTVDSCAKATGCVHLPSGATCTDNDPCSIGSACQGAKCASLGSKSCDDGNSCTVDSCDGKTGKCSNSAAKADTACEDGNPCTANDRCNDKSACVAGPAICALTVGKGLQAHYSAAFSGSLDRDEDGGVTQWRDLSGNGRHLAVVDDKARPILAGGLVHGRAAVKLAGSKGLRTKAFSLGDAASVFAVVCADGDKALGAVTGHGDTQKDWALASLPGEATAVQMMAAGSAGGLKAALTKGSCTVVAGVVSAAGRELLWVSTWTKAGAGKGAALTKANKPLHVGTDDSNGTSGAIVAELLVYDRAVSKDERDDVLTYLRTAWGFAAPKPDFAWFDATDSATVVASKDGAVSTWKDKSGLGRDASAGPDTPPQWFQSGTSNGLPAVRFDGAKVRLSTAAVASAAQMTVLAVIELDKPQAWGTGFSQGHDAHFALRRSEDVKDHLVFSVGKATKAPAVAMKLGQWAVWTAVQDATTTSLAVGDGKAVTVQQAPIAQGSAALVLGNAAGANAASMGGFVAEIQAFSQALSVTDRRFLQRLLRNKYGL